LHKGRSGILRFAQNDKGADFWARPTHFSVGPSVT
jgi:hypothetical protein